MAYNQLSMLQSRMSLPQLLVSSGQQFRSVLAATYSSSAGEALKPPKRRGYIVSWDLQQPDKLSNGSRQLQRQFNCDVAKVVREAAYPLKPGQILLQPGRLGRDADDFVNDLCIVGISAIGQKEPIACGSEPLNDWEVVEDARAGLRKAARALKELGCSQLLLDKFSDNCLSAEAALAGVYSYTKHRGARAEPQEEKSGTPVQIDRIDQDDACKSWELGVALGGAEARARDLMERPANLCTPSWFCENARQALASEELVEFSVREEAWLREQGMGGLLAVAKGSAEPPRLLLAQYRGRNGDTSDACLIGKGVTFDSGGISIKPSAKMADMRADMGGAAVTLSVFLAASQLRLPLNLTLCIPLCENLPDGAAVKPGDVIEMLSGLTVRVDNTDAEGRLLLADALHHCCKQLSPAGVVIDVATLTGAVAVALGRWRAGLFANAAAEQMAEKLVNCGQRRGDLLHRMPLDREYRAAVRDPSGIADLSNIGSQDRMAGACTAAAFLSHFVPANVPWMHIDMAGVMQEGERMTGRPARALLQFLTDLAAARSSS